MKIKKRVWVLLLIVAIVFVGCAIYINDYYHASTGKIEEYVENLNVDRKEFEEVIIEGGCHAYFGMYGEQDGDGKANISDEEQIEITAEAILKFVN